jgi:RNA polymerase sigma factor (sigma-70 family)
MSTGQSGSVSCWIAQVRDGHASAAAHELWNRYFAQLVHLAHRLLSGKQDAILDEEDVALSALNSFFGRLQQDAFPELHDRSGLWSLLVKITVCKATNAINRERAAKRSPARLDDLPDLDMLVSSEPSPSFAAEVADEMRRLFDLLGDDTLRQVARLKLEGYTISEIATLLDVAPRTVSRKLDRIRSEWQEAVRL